MLRPERLTVKAQEAVRDAIEQHVLNLLAELHVPTAR